MKTKPSLWLSFGLIIALILAGLLFWRGQLNKPDLTAQFKIQKPPSTIDFSGTYRGNTNNHPLWIKLTRTKNNSYRGVADGGMIGILANAQNKNGVLLTGYANGQILSLIGNAQDDDDPEVAYRIQLNGAGYDEDDDGAAEGIDFEGIVNLLHNDASVDQEVIKFTTYRK